MPSPMLQKSVAIARFQGFRIQLPPAAAPTGGLSIAGRATGSTLPNRPTAARSAGRWVGARRGGAGGSSSPPTATPMALPPALFLAASNSVADVDTQTAMHTAYMRLFDDLTPALRTAWDQFRTQACFADVKINGPLALGSPGCLRGPALYDLVRRAPNVVGWTGWHGGVRDGFAEGVDKMFGAWQRQVTVPSLPWYPAFAAFPGPKTPQMPNVPTPLVACVSSGLRYMTPPELTQSLTGKLAPKMDHASQFAAAMSDMIAGAFTAWLPQQMVMGVMGSGPVPSFAPPYIAVGPVVMGSVAAAPGHLMS